MVDDPGQLGAASPAPVRGCASTWTPRCGSAGCTSACAARRCARPPTPPRWPAPRPRRGLRVVGVMFYEAQIAGLPDTSPAVRLVKRRSAAELRRGAARWWRRSRTAVGRARDRQLRRHRQPRGQLGRPGGHRGDRRFGLYVPTLFDRYRVVRRRAGAVLRAAGGAPAGAPTSPPCSAAGTSPRGRPASPGCRRRSRAGLALLGTEGAGEVQTPVRGPAARPAARRRRVWFRQAKAGEQLERFDTVHLVADGELVDQRADLPRRGPELRLTARRIDLQPRATGFGPEKWSLGAVTRTRRGNQSWAMSPQPSTSAGLRGSGPM